MKAQSIGKMSAWCGVCLIQSVMADNSALSDSAVTPELAGDNGDWPAFEAAVDFCTRQVTYGLADNRDPIMTAEAAVEWHGFSFESALIFDTTEWGRDHGGYGNRQGRCQELVFGSGYRRVFSPEDYALLPTAVELGVNMIYEYHPPVRKERGEANPNTRFINAGAMLPDLPLAPSVSAEVDIDNENGAFYLAGEIGHSFALIRAAGGRDYTPLALSLGAGLGFGNPKRNACDADFDAYAFKDVWVSASLEWRLSERITLAPYVAVHEQLHRRLREAARARIEGETLASTQVVGGLRLAACF